VRNVISLALFGKDTRYSVYLSSAIRAWKALLPDFEIVVHHDDLAETSTYWPFLYALAQRHVITLKAMGTAPRTAAMLWRIAPVWDPGVDYVFARDIDALPTPRERECILRFIASGMVLSTLHDHQQHDLIMGGLSGYHAPRFREETELASLDAFYKRAGFTDEQWAVHGADQIALNRYVAPGLSRKGLVYEHRWSGWEKGKPGPDPGRRPAYRGVSELVPDVVTVPGWSSEKVTAAEQLVHHLGQADYVWQKAAAFYDIDDSEWNVRIRAAERDACVTWSVEEETP
jgi:hypothetical protein